MDELEQLTFEALVRASKVLNDSDMEILCYHCGMNLKEMTCHAQKNSVQNTTKFKQPFTIT